MGNDRMNPSELTVIASDLSIEGNLEVSSELHLYGRIIGELRGLQGSTIILKPGSLVEGKIQADTLIIDGFVKGQIDASNRVWVTALGKVAGSVKTPSLQVDPGAIFEAKVVM